MARTNLFEGSQQFLVLMLQLLERILRTFLRERGREFRDVRVANQGRAFCKTFLSQIGGPFPCCRFDLKLIHQPARADDPQAHPRGRLVSALENRVQIPNSRTRVDDFDDEQLRRGAAFQQIFDPASSGIIERIARDFRDRRRDSGLILRIETQQTRDLAGALPRSHGVVFVPDGCGKNAADSSRPVSCSFCHDDCGIVLPPIKSL